LRAHVWDDSREAVGHVEAADRDIDIKLLLCEVKQRAALAATPADFGDRPDAMSAERGFHSDVNALV
jgi:hypothetical protein